jgi:hypothetical protein
MAEMRKQEGETADLPVYDQDQQEKLIVKINLFPDSQFPDPNDKPGLIERTC